MRTGCAAGTSTSSSACGPNRCRPAMSSAISGARRRPISAGSRNYVGIKNPAVDALIERVIFAKDRAELVAATKALDRVLLWNHLRRAAIYLRQEPHRALGPFRPARADAEIRRGGVPDRLVVGRREGRQDRDAPVSNLTRWSTRRDTLVLGAGAARALVRGARLADAQVEAERHGMSAFGDLKYPADFKHFDYVNPDAPKGGIFSQVGSTRQFNQNFLTFNSLNGFILKGDGAQGMELTFASLMVARRRRARRDVRLAARAVRISADGLTYRFLMRPEAQVPRRHAAHRARCRLLAATCSRTRATRSSSSCCATLQAPRRPTTRPWSCALRRNAARDVPLFVAALPIFSRAYYSTRPFDEIDARRRRSAAAPTRSDASTPGSFIEYERVKDWWGADLPVARGHEQFRRRALRISTAIARSAFEGFTGKNYLFREEFTSRIWATRYDFPAIKRRPREARRHPRRYAVRRAGLVHQYAAREVQGPRGCARL